MPGGVLIEGEAALTLLDRSLYRGRLLGAFPAKGRSARLELADGTFTVADGLVEKGRLVRLGEAQWGLEGLGLRQRPGHGRLEGRFRAGRAYGLGREDGAAGDGFYLGMYEGGRKHGLGTLIARPRL